MIAKREISEALAYIPFMTVNAHYVRYIGEAFQAPDAESRDICLFNVVTLY
jgi:hypothetical protein